MPPKKVTAAKARASFKQVLTDIRRNGERIKITRYGRTAAWIVPAADGQALEDCREEIEACVERKRRAKPGDSEASAPALRGKRGRPKARARR